MRSRSTSSIHYPQPLDERDDGLAHHRTQRSCARRLPGGGRELYRFGRAGGFADDLALVGAPSVARVDPRRAAGAGGTDRRSVGEGKGGVVRDDLGGSSLI